MRWLAGIAGFALLIAPFVFQYAENALALLTSALVGIVLLFLSVNNLLSGQTHYRHLR